MYVDRPLAGIHSMIKGFEDSTVLNMFSLSDTTHSDFKKDRCRTGAILKRISPSDHSKQFS